MTERLDLTGSWLVKRRHYTGGESLVAIYRSREQAQADADERNSQYQSDTYIIEPYQPRGFDWPIHRA